MDNIDKLIKSLEELKSELQKGDIVKPDKGFGKITIKGASPQPPKDKEHPYGKVILKEELHCSENGQWKLLEKDAKNPALAPKDRKVKELQGKIDAGTYKPDAGKIADAMLKHPEKPLKKEECHPEDPKHEEKEQDKAKKIKENAEEILDLHKK